MITITITVSIKTTITNTIQMGWIKDAEEWVGSYRSAELLRLHQIILEQQPWCGYVRTDILVDLDLCFIRDCATWSSHPFVCLACIFLSFYPPFPTFPFSSIPSFYLSIPLSSHPPHTPLHTHTHILQRYQDICSTHAVWSLYRSTSLPAPSTMLCSMHPS